MPRSMIPHILPAPLSSPVSRNKRGSKPYTLPKNINFRRRPEPPVADQSLNISNVEITYDGVILRKDLNTLPGRTPSWSRIRILPMVESSEALARRVRRKSGAAKVLNTYENLRSARQRAHIDKILLERRRSELHPRALWLIADIEEERGPQEDRRHITETRALHVIFKRLIKPPKKPSKTIDKPFHPGENLSYVGMRRDPHVVDYRFPICDEYGRIRSNQHKQDQIWPMVGENASQKPVVQERLFNPAPQANTSVLPPIILSSSRPVQKNNGPLVVPISNTSMPTPQLGHQPYFIPPNMQPPPPTTFPMSQGASYGPNYPTLQPLPSYYPFLNNTIPPTPPPTALSEEQPETLQKQSNKATPKYFNTSFPSKPNIISSSYRAPMVEDDSDDDALIAENSLRSSIDSMDISTAATTPISGDDIIFQLLKQKDKKGGKCKGKVKDNAKTKIKGEDKDKGKQNDDTLTTTTTKAKDATVTVTVKTQKPAAQPSSPSSSSPSSSPSSSSNPTAAKDQEKEKENVKPPRKETPNLSSFHTSATTLEVLSTAYIRKLERLCRDEAAELRGKLRELDECRWRRGEGRRCC